MSKNENCLDGMRCPKCGSEEPYYITAEAVFAVFDTGTADFQDVEWDDDSPCQCMGCQYTGRVKDFKTE